MDTNQHQADFPDIQATLYRVALSLDSFLVNGIPSGVIHRDVFNGFLEKTAGNLLTEVRKLEEQASHAPAAHQPTVTAVLTALRANCQHMIDLVTELSSFRNFSLEQLRSAVSRIPPLREECVRRIQELECCFRTPKPFYSSRPDHSTATVNDFLANLEHVFTDEWAASREEHKGTALQP